MDVKEFDELINALPKVKINEPISSMNSINIEDLRNAVERLKKIPTYQDLLKENQELKKQLEENKDKINWYENFEINKTIDKLRIKHNNQQKEFIEYLEDMLVSELDIFTVVRVCDVLSKYKEIIGNNEQD